MKIRMFMFQQDTVRVKNRITGSVQMPPGANVIHVGASPPRGELAVWAECPLIVAGPDVVHSLIILRHDDDVPDGFSYVGNIMANPMLFVYRKQG